jgi:glycosyltransferase involved in cell wall biosynthesis
MRICFVAPLANFLFEPAAAAVYGGSEVRAWTLAVALARRGGFEPSMLVQGSADGHPFVRDGVAVHRGDFNGGFAAPALAARLRGALSGSRRADLAAAMARIDPGIVCAFGAVAFNARLSDWCRRSGRASVLFLGSDIDVAGTLEDLAVGRSITDQPPRPDARAALLAADAIVAQTDWQADRVRRATGRIAAVVPSPIHLEGDAQPRAASQSVDVLWIGKTDDIKRPGLALDVARLCPELRFHIVANPTNETIWSELARNTPENVTLISHVPYQNIGALFRSARLLLNTSAFEGFPNAFLQAGKYGIPVVSAVVDPDGILQRNGAGLVAGADPRALGAALRRLASDSGQRTRMGQALAAYVRDRHGAAACAALLARHLAEIGANQAARPQAVP